MGSITDQKTMRAQQLYAVYDSRFRERMHNNQITVTTATTSSTSTTSPSLPRKLTSSS